MNGLVEIKLDDRNVMLRFSMAACMEFERRVFKNLDGNAGKIFTDMVYSGLYGERLRDEMPVPLYTEACDIVDELSERDDYVEQSLKVQSVYEASKWGKDLTARMQKMNEELEAMDAQALAELEEKKKKSTPKRNTKK